MGYANQPAGAESSTLIAYRIADGRYPMADGRGAMLEGGRWNSPGLPVIYASLTQSCAMLEILAHTNIGKVPRHHKMITLEIPRKLKLETITAQDLAGWDHPNLQAGREYGDAWLSQSRTVALIVPSVIAHHDNNILINPLHPDFKRIHVSKPEPVKWDGRLFS